MFTQFEHYSPHPALPPLNLDVLQERKTLLDTDSALKRLLSVKRDIAPYKYAAPRHYQAVPNTEPYLEASMAERNACFKAAAELNRHLAQSPSFSPPSAAKNVNPAHYPDPPATAPSFPEILAERKACLNAAAVLNSHLAEYPDLAQSPSPQSPHNTQNRASSPGPTSGNDLTVERRTRIQTAILRNHEDVTVRDRGTEHDIAANIQSLIDPPEFRFSGYHMSTAYSLLQDGSGDTLQTDDRGGLSPTQLDLQPGTQCMRADVLEQRSSFDASQEGLGEHTDTFMASRGEHLSATECDPALDMHYLDMASAPQA